MGLWSRLRWLTGRKTLTTWPDFGPWRESKAGVVVSTETALGAAAVMACTRAIAEGVAQVPVRFYRGGARLAAHPLLTVLGRRPNAWMTSFGLRETMLFHLVLTGNAFVLVVRAGARNEVVELLPIEPGRVQVGRQADMSIVYRVTTEAGQQLTLGPRDIWHVRGPSWNSWMGLEAVRYARDAIGLSMALETSHARLHKNGLRPSGTYSVEGQLGPEQYKLLREWIRKEHAGADNAGTPLILDRAAKWQPMTISGVDAQHVETRNHQIEEICRHMRVIPMMVGYSDKTSTYASAEQMFIAHVVHTITPWATRWEQSAESALADPEDEVDIRLDLKGLMRGAAADRAEYYAKALGAGGSRGWMTQNEVRGDDGLDPVDGGDELPQPVVSPAAATAGGANV